MSTSLVAEARTISREEPQQRLGKSGLVLLDAQAPGWFEREHLPGAVKMPEVDLATRMRDIAPNRASEIVVYCWSEACTASAAAANALRDLGYRNVRRYAGGKKDWLEAGLAIETGEGRS